LYVAITQNSLVFDKRINCKVGITLPRGPQREAAEQHCEHLYPNPSFADLYGSAGIFLAFTLVPVALLWVVGSIIIVTLRWIRRGFSRPT
jgi:hypothetical protein